MLSLLLYNSLILYFMNCSHFLCIYLNENICVEFYCVAPIVVYNGFVRQNKHIQVFLFLYLRLNYRIGWTYLLIKILLRCSVENLITCSSRHDCIRRKTSRYERCNHVKIVYRSSASYTFRGLDKIIRDCVFRYYIKYVTYLSGL